MRKIEIVTLMAIATLCGCSSNSSEKKDDMTYYSMPFGGSLECEDTIATESETSAGTANVAVVSDDASDAYHEGYEAGYDCGGDDYLDRCGYEGNYDDDCQYSGKKRRDYERGYAEGYDDGYGDAKGDDGSDDPEGGNEEEE